jgi:hypothetical protein
MMQWWSDHLDALREQVGEGYPSTRPDRGSTTMTQTEDEPLRQPAPLTEKGLSSSPARSRGGAAERAMTAARLSTSPGTVWEEIFGGARPALPRA